MLYEEHNVPLLDNDTKQHSQPIPAVIDANTSIIKMDSIEQGQSMEGSQDSLRSDIDFDDCHPIGADDIVSNGYMPRENSKEESLSKPNAEKCRFRDVAKVMQSEGRLASKVPRSCSQAIRLKEKEIALMLEQDMYTVSKFYADQCR